MGQVPSSKPVIGILGGGRLARHLSFYLPQLSIPILGWSRRDELSGRCQPLASVVDASTHLVFAVSDQSISAVFDRVAPLLAGRDRPAPTLIHCSGAHVFPDLHCAHPLMTFGEELYSLEEYRRIPFIIDEEGPALGELWPGLPNPVVRIPRAKRAYYHALCVAGGNFTTLLWRSVLDRFARELAIDPAYVKPFLEKSAANSLRHPERALTGPLARRDFVTIEKNLAALQGDALGAVYRAFVDLSEAREK